MEHKLTDAEITVMNIIWDGGEVKAMDIAKQAGAEKGWKKNTVYTMLSRLVDKGMIERREPGFICTAVVDRDTVRRAEGIEVVDKLFEGSLSLFARAFVREKKLTEADIEELKRIIEENK